MRDFPQELVFALVFGAVWLAQLVYRLVRRKAENLPSDAEPVPVPEPAPEAETDIRPPPARPRPDRLTEQARAVAARPQPVDTARTAPAAATVRTVAMARPPARRFSKAALMPDRRAVQDAVVIAAIMQPCHAQRQRNVG